MISIVFTLGNHRRYMVEHIIGFQFDHIVKKQEIDKNVTFLSEIVTF